MTQKGAEYAAIPPAGLVGRSPSSTRLVKSLKPSSNAKLEVAPAFARDEAPHVGRPAISERAPIKRLGTREQDLQRHGKLPRSLSTARYSRDDRPRPSREDRPRPSREDRPRFSREDRPHPSREDRPRREETPRTTRDTAFPSKIKVVDSASNATTATSASRPKVVNPLSDEFDISKRAASTKELPTEFTSPPLMDGLLKSLHDVLGPDTRPTPIQALSLKHLVSADSSTSKGVQYHEYLLASETGSGKSMAYLLPMIQDLKQSELNGTQRRGDPSAPRRAINPRALVLAPTHELSRQLSGFAKELIHKVKLRVLCGSRANTPSRKNYSAAKMAEPPVEGEHSELEPSEELLVRPAEGSAHPVDIVVGTPSKVLELIHGRGWDHDPEESQGAKRKVRVGEPQMGLADIEWVVVDEADVLLDPDFQEATRSILSAISAARGRPVPYDPVLNLAEEVAPAPLNYPFNFILTSATIPSSLAAYIDRFHPSLMRLASPKLHHLPSTLKTEYFNWTGGNRDADIEHRLRKVWYDDLQKGGPKSKVLVFCNRSTRVEQLGASLREKGIANVALTSAGEARKHGSNHHLDGFLRVRDSESEIQGEVKEDAGAERDEDGKTGASRRATMEDLKDVPHVVITTSLLSRGLDFAPDVKHVFIVDEPRNMVDFLHRAGRSGRAGEAGKVVVFGKSKGRGSDKAKVVRKKVGALAA
ncbi:P-loop containing nucleoside triphosphate hydrolase protein [Fomes fomentarius]|nr:P-loop containing nucleoside triphosphate hydrolase protein [Fomes fomentarius]